MRNAAFNRRYEQRKPGGLLVVWQHIPAVAALSGVSRHIYRK